MIEIPIPVLAEFFNFSIESVSDTVYSLRRDQKVTVGNAAHAEYDIIIDIIKMLLLEEAC